jgi:hypothetical protein
VPQRFDAVNVEVPEDLASLLLEAGLATPATTTRSTLASIVDTGFTVALASITLAQGPLTVVQLRDVFVAWREARRVRRQRIGHLKIRGARGVIELDIDNESDLQTAVELAHRALFPPAPATPANGDYDF